MNKISNKLLRVLLFTVLLPGILGCAASLLFSTADLIFWVQADVYTMREILESLVIRTVDALTFLPVLLLFLAVCFGLRNEKRLQALYTASLICTILLAIARMLTDFLTDGIPEWNYVLQQSVVFIPIMLVVADTLLDHRLLIPARVGALGMTALCGWRLYRMMPLSGTDFAMAMERLNETLRMIYGLAVTLLVFGQLVYYSHAVHKKVKQLEKTLGDAKREYAKGELTEEEYKAKKAQVVKYL